MLLYEFVFELMERILADEELGITESDIRYFDAGVKLDTSEFCWEEANPVNASPTVVKSSSLIIRLANENSVSEFIRFHVGELYCLYKLSGMDETYRIFAENYRKHRARAGSDAVLLGSMRDYEKVRDRLIVRPLNYKDYREDLSQAVYQVYGDMAIVLYLLIDSQSTSAYGQLVSAKIPADLLDIWDMTADEALDAAVKNTMQIRPPILIKIELDKSVEKIPFMDDSELEVDFMGPRPPVVSTDPGMNGAIAAFCPGVLNRLFEITGGPYYVVFSSVNEFQVHPVSKKIPISCLRNMLHDLNLRNQPDEILSRYIYLFDGEELIKLSFGRR